MTLPRAGRRGSRAARSMLAVLIGLLCAGCVRPQTDTARPKVSAEVGFESYAGRFADNARVESIDRDLPRLTAEAANRVCGALELEIERPSRLIMRLADGAGRPGFWAVRQEWRSGARRWVIDLFAEPFARSSLDPEPVVRAGLAEAILSEYAETRGVTLPGWVAVGIPLYVSRLGDRLRLERIFGETPTAPPGEALSAYTRLLYLERTFGPSRFSNLLPTLFSGEDPVDALREVFGRGVGALMLEWSRHEAEMLAPSDDERNALAGQKPSKSAGTEIAAEATLARILKSPKVGDLPALEALLSGVPAYPVRVDRAALAHARLQSEGGRTREAAGELRRFAALFPDSALVPECRMTLARLHLDQEEPTVTLAVLSEDIFSATGTVGTRMRMLALRAAVTLERDGLAERIAGFEVSAAGRTPELDAVLADLEARSSEGLSAGQTRRVTAALSVLRRAAMSEAEVREARRMILDVGRRSIDMVEKTAACAGRGASRVIDLIESLGGVSAIEAVARLASSEDALVGGPAVEAYLRLGGDPRALAQSLSEGGATKAALETLRIAAGEASGDVLARIPDLPRRLASRDAAVRAATATLLGETGLAGAAPPLVRLLREDTSPGVTDAALRALAQVGPPGYTVLDGVIADRDAEKRWMRLVALDALLAAAPARAGKHARRLLRDGDPFIRARTLVALAGRAGAGWAAFAVAALADGDAGVRRIAGAALTDGDAETAVPLLLDAYAAEARAPGVHARVAQILSVRARRDFGHEPALDVRARGLVLERMRAWWKRERGE
jgi:HEAT repeat protein